MADTKTLIPVYTATQANSWLGGIATDIGVTGDIVLILLTVLGFVVFVAGIIRYMRAAREAVTGGGGGDGHREAGWMVVIGVLMALVGGIFMYLVAFGRGSMT